MPNFRDPRQGGMPMQGGMGGMPQPGGTQMGGGPQGPPPGPQGPPPPRPGPGQLGAGGGQGGMGSLPGMAPWMMDQERPEMWAGLSEDDRNRANFMYGQNQDRMANSRGTLQAAIDHAQQQLQAAQIGGAPPQIIASLQAQLQAAQRAYQEAGMRAMFEQQQGRPSRPQPEMSSRTSGRGGGCGSSMGGGSMGNYQYGERMQDWENQMQLLMGLWGLGGGGGFGVGG